MVILLPKRLHRTPKSLWKQVLTKMSCNHSPHNLPPLGTPREWWYNRKWIIKLGFLSFNLNQTLYFLIFWVSVASTAMVFSCSIQCWQVSKVPSPCVLGHSICWTACINIPLSSCYNQSIIFMIFYTTSLTTINYWSVGWMIINNLILT